MKVFHCDHCGHLLFFENVQCISCGRALAFLPTRAVVGSLDARGDGTWTSPLEKSPLRLCENYSKHNVCNWALDAEDPESLCHSCRLTKTIPNLARPGNDRLWYKLEVAKRRLVYTLDRLRLPLAGRSEDPKGGLAFEFLEAPPPGSGAAPIFTGHAAGIITINIAEADDAERVRRRVQLNEPYRTLLGHFRHESGHYYWDRLIEKRGRLASFRELFGDERANYQDALARHYGAPRQDWSHAFVSQYATMHPWEDWAETWAHYLHITDTLETAAACGIQIRPRRSDEPRLTSVPTPVLDEPVPFERMMESWNAITYVLNNLNRGLGNDDAYPFVLSDASIAKLRYVHDAIADHEPLSRRGSEKRTQ